MKKLGIGECPNCHVTTLMIPSWRWCPNCRYDILEESK